MSRKETKFSSEERERLALLFRWVGPINQEQQDYIFWALKRYIDPDHYKPIAGCNCNYGYGTAFNKLRDWYSANGDKFE